MLGDLVIGHVVVAAELEDLSGLMGQSLDGSADLLFEFLFQQMTEGVGRRLKVEEPILRDRTCGGLVAVLTNPIEASPMYTCDEETAQGTVDVQLISDFPQMENRVVDDVLCVEVVADKLSGVGTENPVMKSVERLIGRVIARLELLHKNCF